MEQRFFKVRLTSGRVIGPIDLERIKLFVAKEQITGLEQARLYPTGDWKDINKYPEIAELLLLKLEGKLEVDQAAAQEDDVSKVESESEPEPAPPGAGSAGTSSTEQPGEIPRDIPLVTSTIPQAPSQNPPPLPQSAEGPSLSVQSSASAPQEEATVVEGRPGAPSPEDPEQTVLYEGGEKQEGGERHDPQTDAGARRKMDLMGGSALMRAPSAEVPDRPEPFLPDPKAAHEETAMIPGLVSEKEQKKAVKSKKRKIALAAVMAVSLAIILSSPPEPKRVPSDVERPFRVELPPTADIDPEKSQKVFASALPFYLKDTVDGYKAAGRLLQQAASHDPNNVKALALLASVYMNLIDVTSRDENYFNVVTRLIEMERAKGLNLPETVIADVELYHMLGNPDAAIARIDEFSKDHGVGAEMFYYLSLSFYLKGQNPDALKFLNNIDRSAWFSPRIPFLFGLIYEKGQEKEQAILAFEETVKRVTNHAKARLHLAELYFSKDNLPGASKHADFIVQNRVLASPRELARAFYLRARINAVAKRDVEAVRDLEASLKLEPENEDTLLEYYTMRARLGAVTKEAQAKAKMFANLAAGEKALQDNLLDIALANFLTARQAQENDPLPLFKMAEVFRRKGDMMSARLNLEKAVKLAPGNAELYPKYIRALIDSYEFEGATRQIEVYKGLGPVPQIVDKLVGDLAFRQGRYREAAAYYRRALSSTNVDSSLYVAYASVRVLGRDEASFRDAAFYYGLALRFDPFNVEAVVGAAKALSEIEGLEKAVAFIQNELQRSPHKAALLNGIAEVYVRKGDYVSGLKFADNALQTDRDFAAAHKTRGDAFAAQEKYKEALDAYLTYTNLAPLDPTGHIERYRLFLRKLDLKAGKDEIEKVIHDYPNYPGAYYMLGELYKEGQNYSSALEAAREEIARNRNYLPAYVLAGTVLNIGKEYGKALENLNKALKLDAGYVPALIQAGFANHMMKSYAAAKSLLERAQQLDPGNPQIHKRLGSLYHDLGDRVKARQHFKAYIDFLPDAPDRAEIERYLGN